MLASTLTASLRRPLARALLVLGLLGGAMYLIRSAPQDQALVFRFARHRPLDKMTVVVSTERGEPLRSFTLYRGPRAERRIQHQVKLANGRYRFDVEVFFAPPPTGARSASPTSEPSRIVSKLVTLEGGERVILL